MAEIILGLMGGLGLFLFGMKQMSDGLEKVAGAKMRSILEFFTKTPIRGILVGTFFTAIIQSSSASTVMVVSFVNSGLMNLYQAAGVIMGANIGTTVTSQLISFNLSALAPAIVMAGVVMMMFFKKVKIQRIGEVLLGFGILFMGLTTMSDSMSVLRESPQVVEIMGSLTSHFLAVLVGLVVTTVLQSSSATVGIVLLLANQGLLDIRICFFIIMGCNIGSCVSALLAGLSGKRDAKRAAMIHLVFNIIGTFIIYVVLSVALEPITQFISYISGGNPGREVANAHTLIKLTEVLLLAPFIKQIVKLTGFLVRGEEKKNQDALGLQFIGEKSVFSVHTETLISIVLILQLVRVPFWIYIDAFGLQWVQRWKSIIEAFVNIFLTLLFVGPFKLGVNGVLLGTILSTAMTVSWIEPFVIYKYPLKGNFQGVSELLCKFGLLFGIQTFLGYLGEAYLGGNSLISIMGKVATMLLVSAAMIIIMFGRSNYFWVLKKRLFN